MEPWSDPCSIKMHFLDSNSIFKFLFLYRLRFMLMIRHGRCENLSYLLWMQVWNMSIGNMTKMRLQPRIYTRPNWTVAQSVVATCHHWLVMSLHSRDGTTHLSPWTKRHTRFWHSFSLPTMDHCWRSIPQSSYSLICDHKGLSTLPFFRFWISQFLLWCYRTGPKSGPTYAGKQMPKFFVFFLMGIYGRISPRSR